MYVVCRGAQALCMWCAEGVQVVFRWFGGNVQVTSVEEGHTFHLGDRNIRVLHLPGHSPGSLVQTGHCCSTVLDNHTITTNPSQEGLPNRINPLAMGVAPAIVVPP